MRSVQEISLEISALEIEAKKYDCEGHSDTACVAAGAHDALRWAMGLAETSVSENMEL